MSSANKRRQSKGRGTAGPSGSKGDGLTTEETARKSGIDPHPLRGKVFYLDLHNYGKASNIETDIIELGGVVEKFLCKEVTHVITNRKDLLNTGGDLLGVSTPSPAMSAPSPGAANFKSSSLRGTLDSPLMIDSPNSTDGKSKDGSVVARGKAIAQKAVTTQGKGSTDVLTNAKNWGAKIKQLEKVVEYIAQYKEKLGVQDPKKKGRSTKTAPKPGTSRKGHVMKAPYLKVEDSSRHYKPIMKQLSQWPVVGMDTTPGACPYDGIAYGDGNNAERSEDRGYREEAEIKKSQSSPSTARKLRLMTAGEAKREDEERQSKRRKKGYCECCQIQYTDLDMHLKSDTHQAFVNKPKKYTSLDAMVSEGPNMDRFLEDVLKFQTESKQQIDKMQQFGDDTVLLLSPFGPKSKAKKSRAKPKETSVRDNSAARNSLAPQFSHQVVSKITKEIEGRDTDMADAQLSQGSGSRNVKNRKSAVEREEKSDKKAGGSRCQEKDAVRDSGNRKDGDSDNDASNGERTQCTIGLSGSADKDKHLQSSDKKRKATEDSKNASPKKKTKTQDESAKEGQARVHGEVEMPKRQVAHKSSPATNATRKPRTAKGKTNRVVNMILTKTTTERVAENRSKPPNVTTATPVSKRQLSDEAGGLRESRTLDEVKVGQGKKQGTHAGHQQKLVPSSPIKSSMRDRQPSISRIFSSEMSIEEFSGFTQSDIDRTKEHLEELQAMMSAFDVVVFPSEPDPVEEGDGDVFVVDAEGGRAETLSCRSETSEWENCLSGFLERRVSTASVHRQTSLDEDSMKENNRLQSNACPTEGGVHKELSKGQTLGTAVVSSDGFAVPQSVSVPRRRTVDRQDSVGTRTVESHEAVSRCNSVRSKTVSLVVESVGSKTRDGLTSLASTCRSPELDSKSLSVFEKFSQSSPGPSHGMSSSFLSNIREQRILLAERQKQKAVELERARQLQSEREQSLKAKLNSSQGAQVLPQEPHRSNSKVVSRRAETVQRQFHELRDFTSPKPSVAKHFRTLTGAAGLTVNNNLKKTVNREICLPKEQDEQSHQDQHESMLVNEIPSDSDSGQVEAVAVHFDDNSRSPVFKRGIKNGKQLVSGSPKFKKGVRNAEEYAAIRETPKRRVKASPGSSKWKASEVFSSPRRRQQGRRRSPRKSARKSLMNENDPVDVSCTEEEEIILEQLVLDESDNEIDFPIIENSSPLKNEALMALSPIKTVQGLRRSPARPSPLRLNTDTNAQGASSARVSSAKRKIFGPSPEELKHRSWNAGVTRSAPNFRWRGPSTPRKRTGTPRKTPSKSPSTPLLRGSFSPRTPRRRRANSAPTSPFSMSPTYEYGSGQRVATAKRPKFSQEILHPSWRKGAFTRRVTRNIFRRRSAPAGMTARRNLSNAIEQADSFAFKDTDSVASIRIQHSSPLRANRSRVRGQRRLAARSHNSMQR